VVDRDRDPVGRENRLHQRRVGPGTAEDDGDLPVANARPQERQHLGGDELDLVALPAALQQLDRTLGCRATVGGLPRPEEAPLEVMQGAAGALGVVLGPSRELFLRRAQGPDGVDGP
jgi:hypothetical protein